MKASVPSAVAAALSSAFTSAQPQFTPLGLAPTMRNANAQGISADGSVIVGTGNGPFGIDILGFRWLQSSGPTLVPPLPGFTLVAADGVSGDGRIIVGTDFSDDYAIEAPFVWPWTSGAAPSPLPLPPGDDIGLALAISSDGSTIVGGSWSRSSPSPHGRAIAWRSGAVVPLGSAPSFSDSSACGVSADGSVIVGNLFDVTTYEGAGFRWTAAGGMEILAGPGPETIANAVSDDGRVVVGAVFAGNEIHAARWRDGGPPEDLGSLPGFEQAQATGASADGRIIVGFYSQSSAPRAFVHTDQTGMVDLTQFLTSRGVDLQGWVLLGCSRITPDGNYLIGRGSPDPSPVNPAPWRVHIPGFFCHANCDASAQPPVLNVNDFMCFLNKFAAGGPYANCDNSTTPPVLNALDFLCFLNQFSAGCP